MYRYIRLFSVLGLLGFVTLVALLHVVEPSYAPTTSTVSEYVLGRYGWLMTVAFFSLALGTAALVLSLRSPSPIGVVSLTGLWLWTLGTALAGVFHTDPGGNVVTWHGLVHGMSATVALFSLYVAEVSAMVRLLRQGTATPPARALAVPTGFACIAFPTAIVVGVLQVLPFGLVERGILVSHVLWLLSLSLFSVAVSRRLAVERIAAADASGMTRSRNAQR